MAPESTEARFSLIEPDITAGGASGQYSFRMVVLQRARKHEWAKGSLSVEVTGWGIDGTDSYALSALNAEPNEKLLELASAIFKPSRVNWSCRKGFSRVRIVVEVALSSRIS